MGPGLRALLRRPVAHGREVVEPGEAVQFGLEDCVRHRQVPDRRLGRLDEVAREEEVARRDLPSAIERSH
jgi:hypothetical protein